MYDDYGYDSGYGSSYTDVADSAYGVSSDYTSAANDAWYANDMGAYSYYDGQADSWDSYGDNMSYLATDPTDSSAWSSAYSDASSASWDAWNASVDAYVAGDDMAAYNLNQASIAADSTADATWNAWGDATSYSSYDTSSYDTSTSYSSYDTSSYDTSSSYSSYDTSSYDSSY